MVDLEWRAGVSRRGFHPLTSMTDWVVVLFLFGFFANGTGLPGLGKSDGKMTQYADKSQRDESRLQSRHAGISLLSC